MYNCLHVLMLMAILTDHLNSYQINTTPRTIVALQLGMQYNSYTYVAYRSRTECTGQSVISKLKSCIENLANTMHNRIAQLRFHR